MIDRSQGRQAPRQRRFICSALIGRDRETAALRDLLAEAAAGRGGSVVVSGEAGIGKTRLASQLVGNAQNEGWTVLQAMLQERSRLLPYAPLSGLLTSLLADPSGAAREALAPAAPELAAVVPELRSLFPAAPVAEPAGEEQRRRIIAAATGVMLRLCAGGPCLLFVDDVHWSDDAGLDFLAELAAASQNASLLLLLTYRSEDSHAALQHFLAGLDRRRLAVEIGLHRLSMRESESALRDLLGHDPPLRADLLQAIHGLTEGNPFFIEELVRSTFADGTELEAVSLERLQIPRSIQEAVQRRFEGLSPPAQDLLRLAAVLGTRFDFDLLQAVSGLGESELLTLLRELVDQQLLQEESEDLFVFRHALTCKAISASLLGRERRSLHARVAATIESLPDAVEERIEELAEHTYEAREWQKAAAYLHAAGRRALRLYAPVAAADQLARAVAAAGQTSEPPGAELQLDLGRAYDALGDFERARPAYEAALETANRLGDHRTALEASLALGLLWASRDYERSLPFFQGGVEIARQLDDPGALARSLMRLGNWYSNTGGMAEARRHIGEAIEIFRSLGDERGLAEAFDLLGIANTMSGRLVEGAACFNEALPIFERLGDHWTLASSLATLSITGGSFQTDFLAPAYTLAEARGFAERSLAIYRDIVSPTGEAYALWQLGFCLGPAGLSGRALASAGEALEIATRLGHEQWMAGARCALGAIHADILDFDGAMSHLEAARSLGAATGSAFWVGQAVSLLCQTLLQQNRQAEARALLQDLPPAAEPPESLIDHWRELALAELDLAEGRAEAGLTRVRDAIERSRQVRPDVVVGVLARLEGRLLEASGRLDEAIERLRAAVQAATAQGHRSLLWRCHADLARLLLETGDREGARLEAAEAMGTVEEIASTLEEAAQAEHFRSQAQLLLPAVLRRRPRRSSSPLTERELEVAQRIAEGLSNRAIAEELVLSTRTVETHVANAMAKLGFSSRAQLAAWAARTDGDVSVDDPSESAESP